MDRDTRDQITKLGFSLKGKSIIRLYFIMYNEIIDNDRCYIPIGYYNIFNNPLLKRFIVMHINEKPFFIPRRGKFFDLNYYGNDTLISKNYFDDSIMSVNELRKIRQDANHIPEMLVIEMPREISDSLFRYCDIINIKGEWISK